MCSSSRPLRHLHPITGCTSGSLLEIRDTINNFSLVKWCIKIKRTKVPPWPLQAKLPIYSGFWTSATLFLYDSIYIQCIKCTTLLQDRKQTSVLLKLLQFGVTLLQQLSLYLNKCTHHTEGFSGVKRPCSLSPLSLFTCCCLCLEYSSTSEC